MNARLGDDVDDFCVKCKRLTNHVVVSLLSDGPAKVRCRTCHGDHDYRHEQAPPPKVDSRKAAAFKQVSDNIAATLPPAVDGALVSGASADSSASAEAVPETSAAAAAGSSMPLPVDGSAPEPASGSPAKAKKVRRAQAQ